ncbi:MAG: glutathione transferase GstA [Neisseriaceae bacterium]|jgi:glutathione S-transferase|nr:MAG: glutathione transferase GstA [Neisseriaceae bacterium]
MKLYYSPGTCSLSPQIALSEAGIGVELIKVDLKAKTTASGADYLAINPKGYVPALQLDSGEVLTEGPALLQYIADLAPASNLAPANGTLARTRLQETLNFISTEIHKGFSPLFNPAAPAEWKTVVRDNLGKRFDYLSTWLDKQPYLQGETFTVADGYLFTVLGWCRWVDIDLGKWPVLTAYCARVAERPKVQAALAAQKA